MKALVIAMGLMFIGCAGPAGRDGRDGVDGQDGAPGANGKDGSDGAPGKQGAIGPAGPAGPAGAEGPMGAPGAGDVSGSRLKVRRDLGDDGSSFFDTIIDTTLNVPCAFEIASDGERRCLPVDVIDSDVRNIVYSDPQCAIPYLIVYSQKCPTPVYVRWRAGCNGIFAMKVGAVDTPANIYFKTPAACQQQPTPPTVTVYGLSQVPAGSLVKSIPMVDP